MPGHRLEKQEVKRGIDCGEARGCSGGSFPKFSKLACHPGTLLPRSTYDLECAFKLFATTILVVLTQIKHSNAQELVTV